jgi:sugar phosphate isomerase/epimerase
MIISKARAAAVTVCCCLLVLTAPGQVKVQRTGASKLKLSLNAYSFNVPLQAKTMDIDGLLEFCARTGFDAVDITGYYFPNYPAVPSDDYIMHIKKKAFLLGLDISGTGVRNDFTNPDPEKRKEDIRLVKNWIEVAAKLGAPVVRIFAGKMLPDSIPWHVAARWMVKDIAECVAYGKKFGVMVAIQNHNDFIKTAADALQILKMVDSEWFGLILDTGSFQTDDPYADIALAAPYAVNWQVKEKIIIKGDTVKIDLRKLMGIIRSSGYQGYIPIETLGAGVPAAKVETMLKEVKQAL